MADTAVDTAASTSLENNGMNQFGPFWVSTSTGAVIYVDGSEDLVAKKTTDSGASWSSVIAAASGTVTGFSAFFDGSVPGDTGDKVHCAWVDSVAGTFSYAAFDIGDGSWSTPVTLNASASVTTPPLMSVYICKTRSGKFVAGYNRSSTESNGYRSSDGATWGGAANPFESTVLDAVVGVCPNTGDNDDAAVIFDDYSANAVSLKVYDWSGDSWAETAIGTCTETTGTGTRNFAVAPRATDGHLIVAAFNEYDSATADLLVWDVTPSGSPSVSSLTNALTDSAESAWPSVFIDPTNDDIYVAYIRGTAIAATVSAVYKKSTDDGSTWGSEAAYSEDAEDDIRPISAGACTTAGGRFQPIFYNDDLSDLFINLTNDIEIAAAGGGDPEGSLIRGKLIRGGLLRGGVLVG